MELGRANRAAAPPSRYVVRGARGSSGTVNLPADKAKRDEILNEFRKDQIAAIAEEKKQIEQADQRAMELRKEIEAERASLDLETLAEQRRNTDLKGKMEQLLADCDVLLLPRSNFADTICPSVSACAVPCCNTGGGNTAPR